MLKFKSNRCFFTVANILFVLAPVIILTPFSVSSCHSVSSRKVTHGFLKKNASFAVRRCQSLPFCTYLADIPFPDNQRVL